MIDNRAFKGTRDKPLNTAYAGTSSCVARGMTWPFDSDERCASYKSKTDCENLSFSACSWEVKAPSNSRVTKHEYRAAGK